MRAWWVKNQLRVARYLLRKVFKDQGIRISYSANIAMVIYDNRRKDGRLNVHNCSDVAEKILNTVFGCKD